MDSQASLQELLASRKSLYADNFDPSEYILTMINKGDMGELLQTYKDMVDTEDQSDQVFQELVKDKMESVNSMLKLPVEFGTYLDTMLNSVTNSKKRLREANNCLQMSTDALVETNSELIRTSVVLQTLEAIEDLNNLIFNITQKVEKGLYFEGLQIYLQAKQQFEELDEGIKHAPLIVRLGTVLESKRTEIQQLCIYFLVEQIFSTEVLNPADDIFGAIDFRKLVFKLADEQDDDKQRDLFPTSDDSPRLDRAFEEVTLPKQKIFGDRRVKFLFSMVKNFQGFSSPQTYFEYIELAKIDATLDLMFDKETVKIFEELDKCKSVFSQADDQINYYNIFLSIQGIRQLDPQCNIPEVLLANLDDNFNRIILNCMNAFLKESVVQMMTSHKIQVEKKPLFYWLDEYAKEMLPNSFLLSSVQHLEPISRLFILIVFYCLQYLSDFTKICLYLGDSEAIKQNLGVLVVCMSQKLSFVIEKMFLRPIQTKDEEGLMFATEDLHSKTYEVYKKFQLTRGYFPFVVQIVMRMFNKGLNSLEKRLDPTLQVAFTTEAKGAMGSFSETLYQLYFARLKSDSAFERVAKQPKNLEVFHFKQSDKDLVIEQFFPKFGYQGSPLDQRMLLPQIQQFDRENFKVYLPAAEYIKVLLGDIATLFTMMKYEHHQKYMLGLYNWTLFQFIQLLVNKFSEDINDFNMNTLKKTLGFKELLAADYSYSQFRSHVGLPGTEEEAHYLPPEEYLKVLENTYNWKSLQASKLPIDAFKEDRYVKTGEGCSVVLNCFVAVKQSFNSDFLRILGSINEEVIRRMVNQDMMQEDRTSNKIERESAQTILSTYLTQEMKKPKSETYRLADEIYQNKKGQNFEDFCALPINSQILMLFFYSSKFDRMLHELYLSLKIIIHLTIVIYLSPRLQKQVDEDKIIVSGNLMITFYKKYRLLADTLACNLTSQLTEFLFDETLPLISLQIEENLFELLKYSKTSVNTLIPLLTHLQENLETMQIYEFQEEEIQDITKGLKKFLELFTKIKNQDQLLAHMEEHPMKYSKKQIANFVLAANQQAKDKENLPFNLSYVLKTCAELFKG